MQNNLTKIRMGTMITHNCEFEGCNKEFSYLYRCPARKYCEDHRESNVRSKILKHLKTKVKVTTKITQEIAKSSRTFSLNWRELEGTLRDRIYELTEEAKLYRGLTIKIRRLTEIKVELARLRALLKGEKKDDQTANYR